MKVINQTKHFGTYGVRLDIQIRLRILGVQHFKD